MIPEVAEATAYTERNVRATVVAETKGYHRVRDWGARAKREVNHDGLTFRALVVSHVLHHG